MMHGRKNIKYTCYVYDLCLEGARFESEPGPLVLLWRYSWFYSGPSEDYRNNHRQLLVHPYACNKCCHLAVWRFVFWVTVSAKWSSVTVRHKRRSVDAPHHVMLPSPIISALHFHHRAPYLSVIGNVNYHFKAQWSLYVPPSLESRNRPGMAQRVPGGLGSQISWHSAHEVGEVVSLTHRPPLPSGNVPGTHFH